jgi:hypothetical protein
MNISKRLLAGCCAGMTLVCAFGQPLNSSQQDKALELLRQKIAEERSHSVATPHTTPVPVRSTPLTEAEQAALKTVRETIARERQKSQTAAAPAKPAAPAKTAAPAKPATPVKPAAPAKPAAPVKAATPAVPVKSGSPVVGIPSAPADPDALRAVRQALAAQRAASAAASKASAPSAAVRQEPAKAAEPKASQSVTAVQQQPAQASVPADVKPAGPQSKEQRLSHLLELYKSDRLSPVEYHEQRAKIIAEP